MLGRETNQRLIDPFSPNIKPDMSTDVHSTLNSVFVETVSMIVFSNSSPSRSSMVIASTGFGLRLSVGMYWIGMKDARVS